ncbi:MAG: GH3 auxin-responsive promoter family protein [Candidatus Aminicenantes bacterium]|nr:GH3 auxin-responsive promoter family protein [Candidatus Aminicenantes bacterium]MDH5383325.1 GH3 auxin-responsive promoter family protein [Candidatus Aminicenantes bacterium]
MTVTDPQEAVTKLKQFLQPWHESVVDPEKAQKKVLGVLLELYGQTEYGRRHGAPQIETIEDYRRAFPVAGYEDFRPLIQRVMAGEVALLLSEPPIGWAITRGTTKGESKFIPMTPTDLKMRVSAGRAVMNHILGSGRFGILQGVNLNLNFPSVVGRIRTGEREIEYGYSSGIYLKHVSASTPILSQPAQEEIDALGGGKTLKDWEARFDLAYEKCKKENVTLVGGVAPTAIEFGRFLRRKYRKYPKDLWEVKLMTLGSVPGINTRLKPSLEAMYGPIEIREIYGATEGMFGQQKDTARAWVPNYDLFFLEVQTRSGIKMLHEMRPGEMGSLIVSTPILARYKIGDLIRGFRAPYFRCIGRDYWYTPLVYAWGEVSSLNLDRI